MTEAVAGFVKQIIGLLKIKFQRNAQGNGCLLAWRIAAVSHLGKQSSVHIDRIVDIGIFQSFFIDEFKYRIGEGFIKFNDDISFFFFLK